MDSEELKLYRDKLMAMKSDIEKEIKNIDEETRTPLKDVVQELSSYDNHSSDLGAETFERGKDISLRDNEKILLAKVNKALERIEKGTYGKCQNCGQNIPKERLEAVPYAACCEECQRKEDTIEAERPRPIEEDVLNPPFGRSFLDEDISNAVEYDGEDAWQDVARYGTANSPQDIPESNDYNDTVVDGNELRGIVERTDEIIDDKDDDEKNELD